MPPKKKKDTMTPEELFGKYERRINAIKAKYEKDEWLCVPLIEAEKMWLKLQVIMATSPQEYLRLEDNEKIEIFTQDFNQFYDALPITSRYMICAGQYRQEAFMRFLKKCNATIPNEEARRRDKNYMEDQWIQRQADYARYLWEAYQKGRIDQRKANEVYLDAYNNLKKEFNEFRQLHEDTQTKVKEEQKELKSELLRDMIDRMENSDQRLDDDKIFELLEHMTIESDKQNKRILVANIRERLPVEPVKVGYGMDLSEDYVEELKELETKNKFLKTEINREQQLYDAWMEVYNV